MKQEIAEFQSKMQADLERYRTQMDETAQNLAASLESKGDLDAGFLSMVSEHFKLARDEGAALAAATYTEAEKLTTEPVEVAVPANYSGVRDAVVDISSHDSQSSILKALVDHASSFAPRGAFFIIKNGHLAGWRAFGEGVDESDTSVRDIHFPASTDSVLGLASESRSTVERGAGEGDNAFLDPLRFGHPDRMYAIPLVARGRGVAVLYADHGSGGEVNVEALETLVRTAGMTVELIAAAQPVKAEERPEETAPAETAPESFAFSDSVSIQGGIPEAVTAYEEPVAEYQETTTSFAREEEYSEPETPHYPETPQYEEEKVEEQAYSPEPEPVQEYQFETEPEPEVVEEYKFERQPEPEVVEEVVEEYQFETQPEPEPAVSEEYKFETQPEPQPEPVQEYQFETPEPDFQREVASEAEPEPEYEPVEGAAVIFDEAEKVEPETIYEPETVVEEVPSFVSPVEPFEPPAPIGASGVHVAEATVEVAAPPVPRSRLSDRHVDLPIEVPEEERRLHNDARRFARLLVSEIKLYNEKKVLEGRQAQDLYDRLREAIDRSREMYDKRVQPPVAAKFDYFHYELVNSLAEGDAVRLGGSYPGSGD